jgi:hypothetical protein
LYHARQQLDQASQVGESRGKIDHYWKNYREIAKEIISQTGISNSDLTKVHNLYSQVQELESRKEQLLEAHITVPPRGFLMLP